MESFSKNDARIANFAVHTQCKIFQKLDPKDDEGSSRRASKRKGTLGLAVCLIKSNQL